MELQVALNVVAREVFRDQADRDYIVARAAYRMGCREQFLWGGLHATEKYLKGILLYNGVSARYGPSGRKEFRHDIVSLLTAVRGIEDVDLRLPPDHEAFFKYLNRTGNNRYLSVSTHTDGRELSRLDELVWHLRPYCAYLRSEVGLPDNPLPGLAVRLAHIHRPEHRQRPQLYLPHFDGYLEKLLEKASKDPARQALVWANLFFGSRVRRRIRHAAIWGAYNPPAVREWLTPELRSELEQYVRL